MDTMEKLLGVTPPEPLENEVSIEQLEKNIQNRIVEKLGKRVFSDRNFKFLFQSVGHLVLKARESAEKALQYRDFKVGCSVLTTENGRSPEIFVGYNLKPNRDGAKICAEQTALSSAVINAGDKNVVSIFVAGEAQLDSESNLDPPTLHPCVNCRELISEMLIKTGNNLENVILVTVGIKNNNFEVMSWQEMLDKHKK